MKLCILAGLISALALAQGTAREKVVPSEFDRDHRDQRDEATTRWMSGALISQDLSTQKLNRKVALFLETNRDGEYRTFVVDFPNSPRTWYWEIGIGEELLLRKTETYEGGGVRLLFALESERDVYDAIWVPSEFFDDFAKKLAELGVSPARVEK